MLQCENLTKKYISTTAVDNLTIHVPKGRVCATLGPNGSGKTTFMKMVAGLVKPTAGTLLFDGAPIGVASKARIAYMPTEGYFFGYMNGEDVGRYYADFFTDFDRARYNALIEQMQLPPKSKVRQLSSGMLAKLKLAVTLARDSELVMLDEPLNGIDIIARDQVIDAIRERITPGRTFLLSSHLVDELERIVDAAVFMKDGKLALEGTVSELREVRGKGLVELYKEIYA
ncbi:MAG: ABC transporter ATP-binding protein [Christensenellales bacterium]|jgi:ABC-2 type transport system ATP-binding protein